MLALTLFSSEGLRTEEEDDALFHLCTGLLFIMFFTSLISLASYIHPLRQSGKVMEKLIEKLAVTH